jgi:hypothetical protein
MDRIFQAPVLPPVKTVNVISLLVLVDILGKEGISRERIVYNTGKNYADSRG